MAIVHEEVKNNVTKAYQKYANHYNLRTRPRVIQVGQQVYVEQHPHSDAANKFTGKFANRYLKAFVKEKRGNVYYLLEDENHKDLGVFHLMNIKT